MNYRTNGDNTRYLGDTLKSVSNVSQKNYFDRVKKGDPLKCFTEQYI